MIRFLGIFCSSALVYAQFSPVPGFGANNQLRQLDPDHVPVGSYSIGLVTASGETSIVEQAPEASANKPISGIVSLGELQHPIPKKAVREAYEAQQFARAGNLPKAIAKFEKAIRIGPAYRDAHLNLGVLYARAGRTSDARSEFQKALDIGPPVAPLYTNLAFTSLFLRQYREAGMFARKALELEPANSGAQRALGYASAHGF
jgi:tetratricopeptide (TPR) repeat protein